VNTTGTAFRKFVSLVPEGIKERLKEIWKRIRGEAIE
jgi:hypothetical protein